jgi:hypothetical protein
MLLMFDTCEAQTMYSKLYSPNVLAAASSELGQKSYSVRNPGCGDKARRCLTLDCDLAASRRLGHWRARHR